MKISPITNYIFNNVNLNINCLSKSTFAPVSFMQCRDEFSYNKNNCLLYDKSDKVYSNLLKNMGVMTAEDISNIVSEICRETHYGRDDVLKIMDRISAYSSYKSLAYIENTLRSKGISSISNLNAIYSSDNNDYCTNSYSIDIAYSKKNNAVVLPLSTISRTGLPLCLCNAMSYISNKNLSFYQDDLCDSKDSRAIIVDSVLLNLIKSLSGKNRLRFYNMYINNPEIKFIFLENFENGYNFITQSGSIKEKTLDVINKIESLPELTNRSLEENIDIVLNRSIKNELKEQNIEYITIPAPFNKTPTPQSIAENLNPIVPTKDDMRKIVHRSACEYCRDIAVGESYIFDFLDYTLVAVSPKNFNNNLKILNSKINEFLMQNGRNFDSVRYLIPSINKSFVLNNYQYYKVNNTDAEKNLFLYSGGHGLETYLIDNLPADATLIILDDCSLSGMSFIMDVFQYDKFVNNDYFRNNNISIIFAPVYATDNAVNILQENISYNGRTGIDNVLYVQKINSWYYPSAENEVLFTDIHNRNMPLLSFILPYMGPDNNCSALASLYEKFLYSPRAQKPSVNGLYYL